MPDADARVIFDLRNHMLILLIYDLPSDVLIVLFSRYFCRYAYAVADGALSMLILS